jgi:hypothetical protein
VARTPSLYFCRGIFYGGTHGASSPTGPKVEPTLR